MYLHNNQEIKSRSVRKMHATRKSRSHPPPLLFPSSVSLTPSLSYIVALRPASCISSLTLPLVSAQFEYQLSREARRREREAKRDTERYKERQKEKESTKTPARAARAMQALVKPAQFSQSGCSGSVAGARESRVVSGQFGRLPFHGSARAR